MDVRYNGSKFNFTPLLQVLKVKNKMLFAVEPLQKKIAINPDIVSAIMFNILGFFVQLLEDREQNEFVSDVKKEINNMIDNGFDRFDKGEKIYKKN